MKYALAALLWLLAQHAWAQNSLYDKIVSLRFADEQSYELIDGTADIQSLDLSKVVHIKGVVPFIPDLLLPTQYLSPERFAGLLESSDTAFTKLRMKTNLYPFEGQKSHKGTFLIRFKNQGPLRIALGIPRFFHPMQLTIIDRDHFQRLLVHGDLEVKDPKKARLSKPGLVVRAFDVVDDFYLMAHVVEPADQEVSRLALSSLYIGTEGSLEPKLQRSTWLSAIISGVFLMIAVFYGFIYLLSSDMRPSLYISCFAICSLLFSLFHFTMPPLDNNEVVLAYKILNSMATIFLQLFVLTKVGPGLSPGFLRSAQRSLLLFAVLTFLSGLLGSRALINTIIFINAFSSIGLLIFAIYYGVKNRLSWAGFLVVGALSKMALQLPIFARSLTNRQDELGYTILLANFVMCISLALINANEFAETYQNALERNREIEFLNQNLERLVTEKTKEVRELLDFIPQGVLSIVESDRIDKNYSAHLESILGTKDIAGSSFHDLVLEKSDLSSDAKDRIQQTIQAILGESDLTFELNRDQLPDLISYQHPEGRRILKLTWNALYHGERVRGILLTLSDVSSEVETQERTRTQNRNLIIIQELIAIEAEKFLSFVRGNLPLLYENERVIRSQVQLSEADLRRLFVNVHTVKGAARTYGLKILSSQLHDCEYSYQKLLNGSAHYDQAQLLSELQSCLKVFDLYTEISSVTLNRSQQTGKLNIDRPLLEKIYHHISDAPQLRKSLAVILFNNLNSMISDWKDKAARIARDLSKAEPLVHVEVDDILLTLNQANLLDNCMTHILRNALDHGIENSATRLKSGKSPAGMLRLVAKLRDQNIMMTIQDDGRGLAIERLREQGLKKGLIQGNEEPMPIAELIFAQNMSTAQNVSEVSGRGIGMAAVRNFLSEIGGSIEVRVLDEKSDTPGYYDFYLKISIPQVASL